MINQECAVKELEI